MVTHLLEDLLPGTKEILLLKDGRKAASGTPEAVLTPSRLGEAYGCPVEVGEQNGRWWWSVPPRVWKHLIE
jgi:iron complex transport system ATP-binding protein